MPLFKNVPLRPIVIYVNTLTWKVYYFSNGKGVIINTFKIKIEMKVITTSHEKYIIVAFDMWNELSTAHKSSLWTLPYVSPTPRTLERPFPARCVSGKRAALPVRYAMCRCEVTLNFVKWTLCPISPAPSLEGETNSLSRRIKNRSYIHQWLIIISRNLSKCKSSFNCFVETETGQLSRLTSKVKFVVTLFTLRLYKQQYCTNVYYTVSVVDG